MDKLIAQLKKDLKNYESLVATAEKHGIERLDSEQIEFYGAYLGKAELLKDLIPKLQKLK